MISNITQLLNMPSFSFPLHFILFLDYLMQDFKKQEQPAVDKLQEPVLDVITSALVARFGLNFTINDTSSLWFLCKQVITLLYAQILLVFIGKQC